MFKLRSDTKQILDHRYYDGCVDIFNKQKIFRDNILSTFQLYCYLLMVFDYWAALVPNLDF